MSSAMHRPIEIIQGEGPSIKIGEEFGADLLTVCYHRHAFGLGLAWFMVFNATFNNISVIFVEETRAPREEHINTSDIM
jgi:hypothetical protein